MFENSLQLYSKEEEKMSIIIWPLLENSKIKKEIFTTEYTFNSTYVYKNIKKKIIPL